MVQRAWLLSLLLAGAGLCAWGNDAPATHGIPGAENKAPEIMAWYGRLFTVNQKGPRIIVLSGLSSSTAPVFLLVKEDDDAVQKEMKIVLWTKPEVTHVNVTGVMTRDGKSIQVTHIEKAAPPPGWRKGRAGRAGRH
jgi:hypothetical protein